ncbi:hypothetical protein [uncultured Streptomyces sp.]|uniref:hypothetical protein n=1 Tax=uncultured Streptomyces sp. TaxID=174707 RepID=UPI002606AFEB|nr:hypothetical protein [uncultured Streptomyces sp.]
MKPSTGTSSTLFRNAARATAAFGLAAALAAPLGATAATAAAPAATPPGFSCHTGVHNNDEYTGFALCTNNSGSTQTFWVHLVCGWAPDVDGEHVTLAPGGTGQSTAHCGRIGTGIGEIHVRP